MGNLTKDPEVRYTPSGTAVGDLRMAINRRYKTPDGQNRDETCFVGVTVWSRQAEACAERLSKGDPLLVEGRLKYDEWEKEGQRHSRLSVVAERVQFLKPGRDQPDAESPPEKPPVEKPPPEKPPVEKPAAEPPAESGDDDNLPF
jgi:single-strand DNA-binding protein